MSVVEEIVKIGRPLGDKIICCFPSLEEVYDTDLALAPVERQRNHLHLLQAKKCGADCRFVKEGDFLYVDNSVGFEQLGPDDIILIEESRHVVALLDK